MCFVGVVRAVPRRHEDISPGNIHLRPKGLWRVAELYVGRVQNVIVVGLISFRRDILRILMMTSKAGEPRFWPLVRFAKIRLCAFLILQNKIGSQLFVVLEERLILQENPAMSVIPLFGAVSTHRSRVETATTKQRSYDSMEHEKQQHEISKCS